MAVPHWIPGTVKPEYCLDRMLCTSRQCERWRIRMPRAGLRCPETALAGFSGLHWRFGRPDGGGGTRHSPPPVTFLWTYFPERVLIIDTRPGREQAGGGA